MDYEPEVEISDSAYGWSVRIFSILEKMLSINIRMHHDEGQLANGEIFLFNHFARFETFIPQSLIYKETGAYCRSVASSEFFTGDDFFSNYLLSVGAVPHDYRRLIPYLVEEILRGRKVIIFPEGGMVKDRRVVDAKGRYSVYSRIARERRKHHTGAAVLSLTLDIYKKAILQARARGDDKRLEKWAADLKLDDVDTLLAAASRPSTIVPANITFYPMRVGDNLLRRGVELFNKGISRRLSEELLIEGNILFKNTDMDIRLGDLIYTDEFWNWMDRRLIAQAARRIGCADDVLNPPAADWRWTARLRGRRIRFKALDLRDRYMHDMYLQITVNLSHLASRLIYELLDRGRTSIDCDTFHRMLYLAVKYAQRESSVMLHRSLRNPEAYGRLVEGKCPGLDQFFHTAASLGLVEQENLQYQFLPKLREEHGFDDIRTENLVMVYANEVAPISCIAGVIDKAIGDAARLDGGQLARLYFDDERVSFRWDKAYFTKPRFEEINSKETAVESGEPFLLLPDNPKDMGIVLAHGFLASPAEMLGFGRRLAALGYPVIGPRLKGHGTSPWDLRQRSWRDWLASVRRAYQIMEGLAERVCMVGFSSGGALALRLAADQPDGLAGLAAVSVPIKFRNRNMAFVPMVHGANRLVRGVTPYKGVMPFSTNDSEHPHINYYSMPVRGLFELRQMVNEVESSLKNVHCPVMLIQGDKDAVINPRSIKIIYNKLGSEDKDMLIIPSDRHGILYENTGDTQEEVIRFLDRIYRRNAVDG
ncbi:MAG TPA: alpha/beta fold hydrolase [Sedimenticola sp.]|nr:alpha/beta fold hydrolase [Sedimenticola sp.]